MIIAMTQSRYETLEKRIKELPEDMQRNIKYNLQCFEFFMTFPNDAPDHYKEAVKKLVEDEVSVI